MPWPLRLLVVWLALAPSLDSSSTLAVYWHLGGDPAPPALEAAPPVSPIPEAVEDAPQPDDADLEREDDDGVGVDPALSGDLDDGDLDGDDDGDGNDDDDDAGDGEAQWIVHVVAPRETLIAVATRYRVDHGMIRAWNGLSRRAKIKAGQRLKIHARRTPPPREELAYTVREGDTWKSIGRAHGVDVVDLRKINKERVRGDLTPGQTLEIWIDPTLYAAIQGDAPATPEAAAILPGGFSVGTPAEGKLVNGVRVPEHEDYALLYPGSAWGTTYAVRGLVDALHAWRTSTGYRGTLTLGAMSRERGRPIGGHLSHQSGRDVDIRLPLREGLREGLDPLPRRIAWDAVWALVLALESSGSVDRIFLDTRLQKRLYKVAKEAGADRATLRRLIQFPRGSSARRGLVRHSPGHDIHLHVRFRCAPYEVECAGH
ncbi:MAG: penicillin-insensitive murein endopeptidase [Nannocystaceae bacterium]